jgi:hypothetical protein
MIDSQKPKFRKLWHELSGVNLKKYKRPAEIFQRYRRTRTFGKGNVDKAAVKRLRDEEKLFVAETNERLVWRFSFADRITFFIKFNARSVLASAG